MLLPLNLPTARDLKNLLKCCSFYYYYYYYHCYYCQIFIQDNTVSCIIYQNIYTVFKSSPVEGLLFVSISMRVLISCKDSSAAAAMNMGVSKVEAEEARDEVSPLEDTPKLRRKGGFKLSPSSTRKKTWRKRRDS